LVLAPPAEPNPDMKELRRPLEDEPKLDPNPPLELPKGELVKGDPLEPSPAVLRELPDRELPVRLLMPLLERPMALVLVPPRRLVLMPVLREVPDVDQPNRLLRMASMLAACALRRR